MIAPWTWLARRRERRRAAVIAARRAHFDAVHPYRWDGRNPR